MDVYRCIIWRFITLLAICSTGVSTSSASQVEQINGGLVEGGSVTAFKESPDGKYVVYLADQQSNGKFELYSVRLRDNVLTKLSGTLLGGQQADVFADFEFSPNGSSYDVVFRARSTFATPEVKTYLLARDLDGSGPLRRINTSSLCEDSEKCNINDFDMSPDGSVFVYRFVNLSDSSRGMGIAKINPNGEGGSFDVKLDLPDGLVASSSSYSADPGNESRAIIRISSVGSENDLLISVDVNDDGGGQAYSLLSKDDLTESDVFSFQSFLGRDGRGWLIFHANGLVDVSDPSAGSSQKLVLVSSDGDRRKIVADTAALSDENVAFSSIDGDFDVYQYFREESFGQVTGSVALYYVRSNDGDGLVVMKCAEDFNEFIEPTAENGEYQAFSRCHGGGISALFGGVASSQGSLGTHRNEGAMLLFFHAKMRDSTDFMGTLSSQGLRRDLVEMSGSIGKARIAQFKKIASSQKSFVIEGLTEAGNEASVRYVHGTLDDHGSILNDKLIDLAPAGNVKHYTVSRNSNYWFYVSEVVEQGEVVEALFKQRLPAFPSNEVGGEPVRLIPASFENEQTFDVPLLESSNGGSLYLRYADLDGEAERQFNLFAVDIEDVDPLCVPLKPENGKLALICL